jgi:hypothetical protein
LPQLGKPTGDMGRADQRAHRRTADDVRLNASLD